MGRKKKPATTAQKKAKARKIAQKKEKQENGQMKKVQAQQKNSDGDSIRGDAPRIKKEEPKEENRKFSLNLLRGFRMLVQFAPHACVHINFAIKRLKTTKARVIMMAKIFERQGYIERSGDILRWIGEYAQDFDNLPKKQKELKKVQNMLEVEDEEDSSQEQQEKRQEALDDQDDQDI